MAATADPCASGRYATLPPHQWACALAGSKGQKKNLIHLSISLFPLHGTSPDVPPVRYTQIDWRTAKFAKDHARQAAIPVATCLQQGTRQPVCTANATGEWVCFVRTLRTPQWWHPRSWRNQVDAPGSNPGARYGRAGSTPAERTRWCRRVCSRPGSLVKSRITLGFYP